LHTLIVLRRSHKYIILQSQRALGTTRQLPRTHFILQYYTQNTIHFTLHFSPDYTIDSAFLSKSKSSLTSLTLDFLFGSLFISVQNKVLTLLFYPQYSLHSLFLSKTHSSFLFRPHFSHFISVFNTVFTLHFCPEILHSSVPPDHSDSSLGLRRILIVLATAVVQSISPLQSISGSHIGCRRGALPCQVATGNFFYHAWIRMERNQRNVKSLKVSRFVEAQPVLWGWPAPTPKPQFGLFVCG
jgi:hypothetical protein